MKRDVRELLDRVEATEMYDRAMHPENWTRDGYRIDSIQPGASISEGRWMTVWILIPFGDKKVPHSVGYSSKGGGRPDILINLSGIDRLNLEVFGGDL